MTTPTNTDVHAEALSQLYADWQKRGVIALRECAVERPAIFIAAVAAAVVPKKQSKANR